MEINPVSNSPHLPAFDRNGERWQLVERILASPGFSKSPRLSSFLIYICECALEGKSRETQEQQIGIRVFGRSPAYNPSEDSVVRSQARLLRQKLDEYFDTIGRDEPLQIRVPKGGYLPQFEQKPGPADTTSTPVDPGAEEAGRESIHPDSLRVLRSRIGSAVTAAALLLVCGLLSTDIWLRFHPRPAVALPQRAFWTELFNPRQRTIIVPSDSTLILLEELTKTPVRLAEYSDHGYLNRMLLPTALAPLTVDDLGAHQYTSMADLNLAVRLDRLPEAAQGRVEIRFARSLTVSEMKETNLILIGGERANPWTELFENRTKFHVDFDSAVKANTVVDLDPRPGAPKLYAERITNTEHQVYGVVAFLPGMCGGCDALLVQGTSMAGTEAASDFLFGNQAFWEFIHKITRPDGSLPHFEILLETNSIGGNAPQANILAYHLLP